MKRRLIVAAAGFLLWTAGIEARLVYLQVVRHDDLQARAERQQMRTISAPAKRGEILDRRGRVLAFSVDADSIYAVPSEFADPHGAAAAICGALDGCGGGERASLQEKFSRPRAFVYVKRQVSPKEARRVAALDLEGVGFMKETRRFYPNRTLAAHLLGYVGLDSGGLQGLESAYDSLIKGRAGTVLIQTDARRHAFSRLERPPTSGATLELSIDEGLQYIAERELHAGVVEHHAAGGSAVIMDPLTGEVLAVANEPTFNPNAFRAASDGQRRNRAIQDLYEPGSTFKIVTASAALEEHVVTPDTLIDTGRGQLRIGSRVVEDTHAHGVISFTDVIALSSNIGAIKVGLRLGPERLSRYVRRFGFGKPTSPDFPGESPGIVWDPAKLTESALASVSMGYQVGVTPLQMATAVSAVANGGELLQPRVVHAIVRDGVRTVVPRKVVHRAILPATAATLTDMMEQVVERGTATVARIPGYTIAGKTGTAAKLVNGHYSKSDYNASFVGFIPSRNPVLTIVVVVDTPRGGYFGGTVAAPIFKRIAEAALRQLGVPPSINAAPPVLVSRHEDAPERPAAGPVSPAIITLPSTADGTMPDLRGLGARDAVRALVRLGLSARLEGRGLVVDQRPAPGATIDAGGSCQLWLDRQPHGGATQR